MGWELIVFAVVAAVSAAVSAVGVGTQYKAAKDTAKYNEQVSKQNAKTAGEQALYDAEQTRAKNRRILGAQRAAYSASGVDADSATALDVQQDTAIQGEMDALTAIYTGKLAATGHNSQATLRRMEAGQAGRTGNIAVAGSLLSSGANFAGNPSFQKAIS